MSKNETDNTPDAEPPSQPEPGPAPEAPSEPPAPPATPDPEEAAPTAGADDPSQEQPIMAALAYIIGIIIPIVILVTDMKKSRYMRFHAFQSLFLCVAYIVVMIGLSIISMIFGFIPGVRILAGLLMMVVYAVVPLAVLILAIVLAIKAYNKQEMVLPVIGEWATAQADKMKV